MSEPQPRRLDPRLLAIVARDDGAHVVLSWGSARRATRSFTVATRTPFSVERDRVRPALGGADLDHELAGAHLGALEHHTC